MTDFSLNREFENLVDTRRPETNDSRGTKRKGDCKKQ